MALGILGAALGAASSIFGANKAQRSAEKTARQQMALQREFRAEDLENLRPYRETGLASDAAYQYELGFGDRPDGYSGYSLSPSANYLMTMGMNNIESGAAARGGLFSGATALDVDKHRMGTIAMDRDNHLNRLASGRGVGLSAAAGTGQANQYYGGQMSNALANRGNAQMAGAIAQGNALTNFVNQGAQYYGYAKGLDQPSGGGFNWGRY